MAAKKADGTAVSPVQEELAKLLGKDMPKGKPEDQKFLKALLICVIGKGDNAEGAKLSEDQWDDLSEATRNWATEAAQAMSDREPLPALPEAAETDDGEEVTEEASEPQPKKARKAKAAKAEAANEEEETEEQEEQVVASSSDESAEEETDDNQGKESEMAATKQKRGTKAATAKTAKTKAEKPEKPEKAQKRASKANGHATKKAGVDVVFELVIRNPKSGLETVIEKAKAAGVDTSDAQIGTLYRLAQKYHAKEVELGKLEN